MALLEMVKPRLPDVESLFAQIRERIRTDRENKHCNDSDKLRTCVITAALEWRNQNHQPTLEKTILGELKEKFLDDRYVLRQKTIKDMSEAIDRVFDDLDRRYHDILIESKTHRENLRKEAESCCSGDKMGFDVKWAWLGAAFVVATIAIAALRAIWARADETPGERSGPRRHVLSLIVPIRRAAFLNSLDGWSGVLRPEDARALRGNCTWIWYDTLEKYAETGISDLLERRAAGPANQSFDVQCVELTLPAGDDRLKRGRPAFEQHQAFAELSRRSLRVRVSQPFPIERIKGLPFHRA